MRLPTLNGHIHMTANMTTLVNIGVSGSPQWTHEVCVQIPVLSDGTNTFIWRSGFGDTYAFGDQVDMVYFEYSSADSAFWRICTGIASTRTKTNTSVTVAAATWYVLKFVVNAAGTSVEYFINDVSVGTITTNIPAGTQTSYFVHGLKTLGGTQRDINIDYVYWAAEWPSGTRYT